LTTSQTIEPQAKIYEFCEILSENRMFFVLFNPSAGHLARETETDAKHYRQSYVTMTAQSEVHAAMNQTSSAWAEAWRRSFGMNGTVWTYAHQTTRRNCCIFLATGHCCVLHQPLWIVENYSLPYVVSSTLAPQKLIPRHSLVVHVH
jgi:hypothetical protein